VPELPVPTEARLWAVVVTFNRRAFARSAWTRWPPRAARSTASSSSSPEPPRQLGGQTVSGPRLSAGRYALFLKGSYGMGDSIVVDRRTPGATSDDLNLYDAWQPVGRVDLSAGPVDGHIIGLGRRQYPSRGHANITGALAFPPFDTHACLVRLPRGRERALCRQRVDWIEAKA